MSKPNNAIRLSAASPNGWQETLRTDRVRRQNKEIAIELAKAGIAVLFVKGTDKTPLTLAHTLLDSEIAAGEREAKRRKFFDKNGFEPFQIGATTDRVLVRKLLSDKPDLLPAISCGPSGLVVVDNDIKERSGATRNGVELFDAFVAEQQAKIPERAVVVQTQGGGRHIYFANPDGCDGSSAGTLKQDCETDVKGVGGYVVAPGVTRIHDGKQYGSRADTVALIKAFKAGALPQLPQFVREAIGNRTVSLTVTDIGAERALMDELRQAELPDGEELIDPSKGGFDLEALAPQFPKWQKVIANGNRSECRFGLLVAIKTKKPNITESEQAAILLAWSESGTFVDDEKPGQGEFNWRNVARDIIRARGRGEALPEDKSIGDAFGAVDESHNEANEAREIAEDKRSKRQAEIAALNAAIERTREAVALDEPGAADRLADFERLRKRVVKDLDRLNKSEAERAAVRTKFLFARDFESYTPPDQLIENLIPAVGLTILVGDANVGKTFALLEMVRCLEANGEKFLGRNVDQCGALLVTGEGHAGLGSRLSAVRKRWPNSDIAVHTDLPTFADDPDAAIRKLAAILDEREAVTGRKVKFLALDNLLLMAGKADMNTTHDSSPILKALTGFANERKISIVLAAHENRSGREPGSYAWKALCDNMLFLKSVAGKGKVRELTGASGKVRDGDREVSLKFKLAVVDLGVTNKWDNRVTSCVVEPVIGPEMPAVTDDEDPPTLARPDRLEHRVQAVVDVFERKAQREKADDESVSAAASRIELQSGEIEKAVNAQRVADGLEELGRSTVQGHILAAVEAGSLAVAGTAARPRYQLA